MRMNVMLPCVVLALLGFTTAPVAQTGSTIGDWQFSLQVPKTSQAALKSGEGLAWATFLKDGLTLNARGSSKLEVVVIVLEVQDGRVIQRWSSSAFTASAGSSTIAGRQFPTVNTASVDRTSRVQQATPAARPVDTATLLDSDNLATVVSRDLVQGRLLVIFVAPQRTGSGSTTSPLFVDFEQHGD